MSKITDKRTNPQKQDVARWQDYHYAFASTLNQMVNYIPWKLLWPQGTVQAYALTVEDNPEFNNEKWNKNLATTGLNFTSIEIKQKDNASVEKVKDTLIKEVVNKIKDNKIIWNITGGQRTFVMAVMDIVQSRPNDRLCYVEGNTEQVVISAGTTEEVIMPYTGKDMGCTADTVLSLMGFEVMGNKNMPPDNFYKKLFEEYIKDKSLQEKMIKSNFDKNVYQDIINHFAAGYWTPDDQKLIREDFHPSAVFPFGYVLEKMVVATISQDEKIRNQISELRWSTSLNFSDLQDRKDHGGHTVDEFDIVLVSKSGKLVVFECKSGGMTGDVAKSTRYSVYAVAGVYGKPILITPLLASEIAKLNGLPDDPYKHIKSAIRSAKRATLEVWGIDEVASKLQKHLNLS